MFVYIVSYIMYIGNKFQISSFFFFYIFFLFVIFFICRLLSAQRTWSTNQNKNEQQQKNYYLAGKRTVIQSLMIHGKIRSRSTFTYYTFTFRYCVSLVWILCVCILIFTNIRKTDFDDNLMNFVDIFRWLTFFINRLNYICFLIHMHIVCGCVLFSLRNSLIDLKNLDRANEYNYSFFLLSVYV